MGAGVSYVSLERDLEAGSAKLKSVGSVWATGLKSVLRRARPSASVLAFLTLSTTVLGLGAYLFFEESLLVALRLVSNGGWVQAPHGAISLGLLGGVLVGRRYGVRPFGSAPAHMPDAEIGTQMERAERILAAQPNAAAGLVRLGDKRLLFSDCDNAFIMYACRGRSWVALFDPVGCPSAWRGLILKFMDEAHAAGCRAVFYQVTPAFLPHAVEAGMTSYKLGEQAVVDLSAFDLKGGAWLKLRRSVNRAVRDGLEFSLVPAEAVPDIMDELSDVSTAWLEAHNAAEKGFSLGTFQPQYVASGPVGVIRHEGRIIAFASLLTSNSEGDAFIDLMRHLPQTHRGAMDLLFVRLMEALKAEGFSTLNLGMAPLAGLSVHRHSPLWNRLAQLVFRNGERLYNFQGVLAFKSKFDPQWQPRYLAVRGSGMPVAALFDTTMLIGGGLKGVLRK
jgi:phosphatidylglycerol lysyltransferase